SCALVAGCPSISTGVSALYRISTPPTQTLAKPVIVPMTPVSAAALRPVPPTPLSSSSGPAARTPVPPMPPSTGRGFPPPAQLLAAPPLAGVRLHTSNAAPSSTRQRDLFMVLLGIFRGIVALVFTEKVDAEVEAM